LVSESFVRPPKLGARSPPMMVMIVIVNYSQEVTALRIDKKTLNSGAVDLFFHHMFFELVGTSRQVLSQNRKALTALTERFRRILLGILLAPELNKNDRPKGNGANTSTLCYQRSEV